MPVSKAFRFLSFCCIAVTLPGTGSTSATAAVAKAEPVKAEVPFDPPTDRDIRYRWQRQVTGDGKLKSSWANYSIRFSRNGENFRLVIREQGSGDDSLSPVEAAAMDRLRHLLDRPIILDVDADGVITGMDDAESYWSSIFSVLRQELGKETKDKPAREAMENFLRTFEGMSPAARLGMLTQNLQPITEFASTSTEVGKPITADIETETPFGVKATQTATINLVGRTDSEATIQTRTTLPEAELRKIMAALMENVRKAGRAEKLPDLGAMKFERYLQESNATHRVALGTGLLNNYRLVSVIEIAMDGKTERREDVRTLTLVD